MKKKEKNKYIQGDGLHYENLLDPGWNLIYKDVKSEDSTTWFRI
jgi:hypothetical protein